MGEFVLYFMKRGPIETNKRHRPNGKVIENQTWQLNICSISLGYGKRSDICTLIFCKGSGKNRNLVRVGVVENLLDYSWSSYPTYVAAGRKEPWLTTSLVLGIYGAAGRSSLMRNRPMRVRKRAYWMNSGMDSFLGVDSNETEGPRLLKIDCKSKLLILKMQPFSCPELMRACNENYSYRKTER